jgi:hypothetical protein
MLCFVVLQLFMLQLRVNGNPIGFSIVGIVVIGKAMILSVSTFQTVTTQLCHKIVKDLTKLLIV